MSDEFMAANTDESVEIANSNVEQETTEQVSTEVETREQPQDVTQTQAFSRRLKEETTRVTEQARRERDSAIAELYGQSHGITTWDQYQQAKTQAEAEARAQQVGMDPQLYQEFMGMKQELGSIRHEKTLIEQDQKLASDPNVGQFYTQFKPEVQALAQQAKCDYDIALTMLLRDKIPQLLNSTKSTAEQDAVKRLINNGQSSPGSLSQGGANPTSSISSMSKSDFAKLQEQVLRGERKQI